MYYMKECLGAWQVGGNEEQGQVEFKLFFPAGPDPRIKSIRVAGDFQHVLAAGAADWDFGAGPSLAPATHPEGILWSYRSDRELPAGFYEYKYLVTFDDDSARIVSDPCTRYGGCAHQNAGFVIGGSRPVDNMVIPLASGRKPLRELILYELMIDDFTDEYRGVRAPLDAVADKLSYLQDLGVNAILFMPWTAWKHRDFDWGYEPFQYFAVEYRYANDLNHPEEKLSWLKKLVNACHQRDIHVIMDGVFNHVSVDFPYQQLYLQQKDCPFTGTFGGTFTGLQDLDFNNQCTRELIRDVCLYWMETFGIDGIRFDNTVNFLVQDSTHGLPELLTDLDHYCTEQGEQHFSLTLEHLDLSAARVTNETKATSYWDNGLYGQCFGHLWHERLEPAFLSVINNQRFLDSAEKVPTLYLSNHDHAHVTWQAGARNNVGAASWARTQPWAIALFTAPGVPLIQNGQEFGEDHWIVEDDHGTGRRVMPRPLRWKECRDEIGQALLRLYGRLGTIRRDYPALCSANFYPESWEDWMRLPNDQGYGLDAERQIVIYHRWGQSRSGGLQRFMILINFSGGPTWVTVPFPDNGTWVDLLSHDDDARRWKPVIHDHRLSFEVGGYWGHIFFR